MTYPTLRTIHLLCGTFAVPALVLYGLSAVQMAHSRWFNLKPAVTEADLSLSAGHSDGRTVAREVMASRGIRGDITAVTPTPAGFNIRITVPGTVHDIRYEKASGATHLRTSTAGVWGTMNRLHHAAGVQHEYALLNAWGLLVALVSLATLGLGVTGLWMWWQRRQERLLGVLLLAANMVFVAFVLIALRLYGP